MSATSYDVYAHPKHEARQCTVALEEDLLSQAGAVIVADGTLVNDVHVTPGLSTPPPKRRCMAFLIKANAFFSRSSSASLKKALLLLLVLVTDDWSLKGEGECWTLIESSSTLSDSSS
jgi:hypothetical protein